MVDQPRREEVGREIVKDRMKFVGCALDPTGRASAELGASSLAGVNGQSRVSRAVLRSLLVARMESLLEAEEERRSLEVDTG